MPGKRTLGALVGFGLSCLLCSGGMAEPRTRLDLVSFVESPYVLPTEERPDGLVVDYVKTLMQKAGYDYSITILPPKRALIYALNNANTCVFPVERSQEREVEFKWVSPVLISRHGFFHKSGMDYSALRSLGDVGNLRLGSYLGSSVGDYLISLGFNVDIAAENSANFHKLMADRIDLWASDVSSAHYIAAHNDAVLPQSPLVFFSTVRAMACHSNVPAEVLQNLNATLHGMHHDGSFDKIKAAFAKRIALPLP